jgi:hypothetical protein
MLDFKFKIKKLKAQLKFNLFISALIKKSSRHGFLSFTPTKQPKAGSLQIVKSVDASNTARVSSPIRK